MEMEDSERIRKMKQLGDEYFQNGKENNKPVQKNFSLKTEASKKDFEKKKKLDE